MARVIHFEILVDNPDRTVKFYTSVFDWKVDKAEPMDYWLATTGPEKKPGINGALTRREGHVKTTTNTIDVPSVDEFIKKVVGHGGKAVTPGTPIPGIGYFAYCQDRKGTSSA